MSLGLDMMKRGEFNSVSIDTDGETSTVVLYDRKTKRQVRMLVKNLNKDNEAVISEEVISEVAT